MSTSYDYALALIDNEVHRDCEYHVYNLLRDAVDALEAENAKLRKLVRMQDDCIAGNCERCKHRKNLGSLDVECELDDLARELGIEVEE